MKVTAQDYHMLNTAFRLALGNLSNQGRTLKETFTIFQSNMAKAYPDIKDTLKASCWFLFNNRVNAQAKETVLYGVYPAYNLSSPKYLDAHIETCLKKIVASL